MKASDIYEEMNKMKRTINLFCLMGCLAWFSSCQKDTDQFIPVNVTGPDTTWVSVLTDQSPVNILKFSLAKERVLDSTDATLGGTIQTREGLTITLPAQCLLLPNNSPATGRVFAETFLIKQKGDMVRMDKPTTSNGRVLVSGGEIFVRFRKETEELHLAPGRSIYLKYADAPPSPFMRLFLGDESNPERFNWLPYDSSQGTNSFVRTTLDGYEMSVNRLRWINCDYFADSTGQKVKIIASLPLDFTNANTAVYLVFRDTRTVVALHGDFNTKKFLATGIVSGKQAVVISITKKGPNSFYLAHENFITGSTGTINGQVIPLSPQPTSLPDIKTYLSTL